MADNPPGATINAPGGKWQIGLWGWDWLEAITIARERERLPPDGHYAKGFAFLLICQSLSTGIKG